jgi:lipoprotein NlpI
MNINRTLTLPVIVILMACVPVIAQNSYPNLKLAHTALDADDWDAAIKHLTAAIQADEAKGNVTIAAGVYKYRCQAYFNKEKFELAISDCDKSIEIKPDDSTVYHLRAASLGRIEKHDRAIADLTHAIQLAPKEASHYFSRGIAHSRNGNGEQAIADFTKTLELEPNDADALLMRAQAFKAKGDHDQALFDYEAYLKLKPRDVDGHIGVGLAYRHKKDFDRALASFSRALEINPRSKDALLFRGVVYTDVGEHDLALRDFNEVLRLDPAFPNVHAIRGDVYLKKGNYKAAVADLTKGLEEGPRNSTLYSRMWANLYADDGRAAAADAQKYLQAVQSGSQRPYAVIAGYLGLRKQNNTADATSLLRSALKQADDGSWPTQVIHFFLGDISEKQLTELATDNDKATEAHAYIGMIKLFAGDTGAARSRFEWVKANGNRTFSEYELALAELGRLPRATQ